MKCLFLVAANSCIIVELTKKRKQKKFSTQFTGPSQQKHRGIGGKMILLASSVLFLVTQLPQMINGVIGAISLYPFCALNYPYDSSISPVFSILSLILYSLNFYFYFAYSAKFRDQAKFVLRNAWKRFVCSKWMAK